jgi:ABC-type antimicrobial peptide transport system permease subunit
MLSQGEVYVSSSLASTTGIEVGDVLFLKINVQEQFFGRSFWRELIGWFVYTDKTNRDLMSNSEIAYLPVIVKNIYWNIAGKYQSDVTVGMIMEYEHFLPYLVSHLNPLLPAFSKQNISSINLYEYAATVNINLPPPRIAAYMESNYDTLQRNVISWAGAVLYKLGFNQLSTAVPVLSQLFTTRFFSLFLGLILNLIILILLFLSILLIYSLLMINVETRMFEFGILRMVGTTRKGIIGLLLVQAFSYAAPSWIFGLVGAQIASFWLISRLRDLTGVPIDPLLTFEGITSATVMGVIVPIASAILPIRSALTMNLHDSLDTKHSKTKAVKIDIERDEQSKSISVSMIMTGIGLTLFGATIYYVFPLALLSMNLGLLLNVFFFILGGMLLGLALLSVNLQRLLEQFVVAVFLWWDKSAIRELVKKNLVAHRLRNQKTTIMYSLSLGFIIFISVAYSIQIATFAYQKQQSSGSLLQVRGGGYNPSTRSLDSIKMKAQFEELTQNYSNIIKQHAWITYELRDVLYNYPTTKVTNLGRIYDATQRIYGVTPNIFHAAIQGFLHVDSSMFDGVESFDYRDLPKQLYTAEGSSSAIVGSLYKVDVGLQLNEPFILSVAFGDDPSNEKKRIMKPIAFLNSAPAFTFSKFPLIRSQAFLVSLPTFLRLTNGLYTSIDDIPMRIFLVEFYENVTDKDIDTIKVEAYRLIRAGNSGCWIWDYRDNVAPFQTATTLMSYFFNFTTVIAMLVSFFSLMSSMFTNIHEQTKEIGILRAIGIRRSWMYRIYIYEAFVLVLSSSLLGVVIGVTVAVTMTMQQSLFTQLPIPFTFPTTILLVVFLCSVLFSVLAAFSPVKNVMNKSVVHIFRILN